MSGGHPALPSPRRVRALQERLLDWYADNRRDLPWRRTTDPYAILVSEIMLQQTQVPRVVGRFAEWLEVWPDLERLAAAPLAEVLQRWQGLGYNTRARRLQACAQAAVTAAPDGLKERLSGQRFVGRASHVLVLVADSGKIPGLFSGSEDRLRWAHATAGAIAQNVYLMGAARGVGTCLVAGIDEGAIRKGLNLSNTAIPLYVMPLGYEEK